MKKIGIPILEMHVLGSLDNLPIVIEEIKKDYQKRIES